MTFGANHYVPVLKVKRGEKATLTALRPSVQQHVTPFLEIVERTASTVDAHLNTAFRGLASAVQNYDRCFLDARGIEPDGPSAAAAVFDRARMEGITFTPVTGISRTADVEPALRHSPNGVAVRLTRSEFEGGTLARDLASFMAQHSLSAEGVDLIVDLGPVEDLIADGVIALGSAFLSDVPTKSRWRTLTISGCAFPLSMGVVDRNAFALVERSEWVAWRDGFYARRDSIERLPTFSDCAIQHPAGVEGFDPRYMQVSASIRYARSDNWLLVKGEGTRNNPAIDQFPQLATRLVYRHLRSYFAGASHCEGCASAKASADGIPGLGSAEVWRRIGTIHHITTVVEGLALLTWP